MATILPTTTTMALVRLSQSRLPLFRKLRHIAGGGQPRFRRVPIVSVSPFTSDAAKASTSAPHRPIRAAFVGLGNMGLPMALNLSQFRPIVSGDGSDSVAEVHVTAFDADEGNVSKFLSEAKSGGFDNNVTRAGSLEELAEGGPDFVFTSLPSCEASEAVVGEIARNIPPPQQGNDDGDGSCVFVDASTVSPAVSRKMHALVKGVSPMHDFVDAPVSGGVKGATEGTLTFMVGCDSEYTLRSVEPLLHRMGRGVISCGGPGTGSAAKLCNNLALAAQMAGICEAMNLGEALGVDPAVLAGVMNVSTAKCWSCEVNNPHPAAAESIGSGASASGYDGGFGTSLMVKDMNLALGAGESEGVNLPVSLTTRNLWALAELQGLGKKDFGVLLQFLKGKGVDFSS